MQEICKMRRRSFPVIATLLFLFALFWLLNELKILIIDIPWLPVILIVMALGMIIDRLRR